MKPVDQTLFGFKEGNCWIACIASILELSIDKIPNFCKGSLQEEDNRWFKDTHVWLKNNYGLSLVGLTPELKNYPSLKEGYSILCGSSPRGKDSTESHACVYYNGEIVHDPHPSRNGLIDHEVVYFFVSLNAAIETKRTIELEKSNDPHS